MLARACRFTDSNFDAAAKMFLQVHFIYLSIEESVIAVVYAFVRHKPEEKHTNPSRVIVDDKC